MAIGLLIFPSIIVGLIASIMELAFVHSDEGVGAHWLTHGLHAVPVCIIGAIISMNAQWALSFIPGVKNMSFLTYVVPVVIGLVIAFKVKGAAAIIHGHGNVGEKLPHALAVGAVIAIAPFIWPVVAPLLPAFLRK
jgi:hypothetical protein